MADLTLPIRRALPDVTQPGDPIWTAALRRGTTAHQYRPDQTTTPCGRWQERGHQLDAATATERYQAVPCTGCWPDTPG